MESRAYRGHAVCITGPFQSHIKALLKFAKLLHREGFHITFVNTEFIHKRLLISRGHNSLDSFPNFRFETIPDGLPPPTFSSDDEKYPTRDPIAVCKNIVNNIMLQPFLDLLAKLDNGSRRSPSPSFSSSSHVPPVTCIISDAYMSFTVTAAEKFGLPIVLVFPLAASTVLKSQQLYAIKLKDLFKLKDESCLKEEYLDTVVEGIPGMKDKCIRDLLSLIKSTDPENPIFDFGMKAADAASKASAIVIHTFDALESKVLDDLSSVFPSLFSIGPLQLFLNSLDEENRQLNSIGYSLWKEDNECLKWLDSKQPNSVIHVNFGSGMVITRKQFIELAIGLVNSDHNFLWVIRDNLVADNHTNDFPIEFEIIRDKGKCLIASWCPQEEVLNHPSVGGFLTHCGWGSTMESLSSGVPMICWPFIAEQQLNCRCICREWKVGMEIEGDQVEKVKKRNEVEKLVRELMGGDKGKNLRDKAAEWKRLAEAAVAASHGSSFRNLEKLVNQILAPKDKIPIDN